jgi:hypothetical protein
VRLFVSLQWGFDGSVRGSNLNALVCDVMSARSHALYNGTMIRVSVCVLFRGLQVQVHSHSRE